MYCRTAGLDLSDVVVTIITQNNDYHVSMATQKQQTWRSQFKTKVDSSVSIPEFTISPVCISEFHILYTYYLLSPLGYFTSCLAVYRYWNGGRRMDHYSSPHSVRGELGSSTILNWVLLNYLTQIATPIGVCLIATAICVCSRGIIIKHAFLNWIL